MNTNSETMLRPQRVRATPIYSILTVGASLIALAFTFLLADSNFDMGAKALGFAGIIGSFLSVCTLLYFRQTGRAKADIATRGLEIYNDQIDNGLLALGQANELFAGALKTSDAFRLTANRVKEFIAFQSIDLLLLDKTRTRLVVAEADGSDTRKGFEIDLNEGIAGRSVRDRIVEIGTESRSVGENVQPVVAVPLMHGAEVFGVLRMYFDSDFEMSAIDESVFDAIGTRAAPLILSSIAKEQSQANALTDVTTDLPNERAFFLILENQIAESMRKRDERPLTVLAFDIKDFDNINLRFGHAAGDDVLNFAARVLKDHLRQMDFLAHSAGDEYLAILPTASKEISQEIIARIHTGFFGRKLRLNDAESIEIELNVGWAAFGDDGDTPGQLLSVAQLRKGQSKSSKPNKVLWFPQELAN